MMEFLGTTFKEILKKWNCDLNEFGGEPDHVHLLIDIHPALDVSALINNLKSASSKKVRNAFKDHVAAFYWKPYFWNRAYFVSSVGVTSLETIKNYIENQGKGGKAGESKPLAGPAT